ncbi:MAG: zinc ribbon domain-containing protein [Tepidanaerobacteraceae bacterium]|jgi:predicted  nucleic acid-binding Zn-ribbon protein
MTTQTEKLYKFQELEIREVELNSILRDIPEKKKLIDLVKQIQQLDNFIDQQMQDLARLKNELYRLESYSKDLTTEIKLLDDRIYSGEVKTVKELEKLQKKQTTLKKKVSNVDDTALSIMEQIEEIESNLSSKEKNALTMKAEYKSERLKTRQKLDKIISELAVITSDKERLVKEIASDLLKKYEKVKKLKNPPISVIINGKCSGCRMEVPIMVAQEVKRNEELIYCENCGRILLDLG